MLTAKIEETKTKTKPRILAVDDNEDMLELIRRSLEDDYDVVSLSESVDVYEILDIFEPDLLLIDIMMPKLNGYQLLEMLRRSRRTSNLPIIVLSAKNAPGEIKHGYRLGATMYLTKPFAPERLKKNVSTQFEVHPPNPSKSVQGRDLARQLELTASYRRGHLIPSESISKQDTTFIARRKVMEKIRKQEEANKRLWRG